MFKHMYLHNWQRWQDIDIAVGQTGSKARSSVFMRRSTRKRAKAETKSERKSEERKREMGITLRRG
jgi:hypothetical protein